MNLSVLQTAPFHGHYASVAKGLFAGARTRQTLDSHLPCYWQPYAVKVTCS